MMRSTHDLSILPLNSRRAAAGLWAVLLLSGCADSEPASDGGGDATDTDAGSEDTAGDDAADADESGGSTSGMGGDETTGGGDDSDGGSDESGTTGEPTEPNPYRIVFTSRGGGATDRMYVATPDFEQIESLTPVGVYGVGLEDGTRPMLHPDGRHFSYSWGTQIRISDAFSLDEETVGGVDQESLGMQWSPITPELYWLESDGRLRRAARGASASTVFDFSSDGKTPGTIGWALAPAGDRIAVRSRPDGAQVDGLWVMDLDGGNPRSIVAPTVGIADVGATGVFHTALGDTPLYEPVGDEAYILFHLSEDGTLLVLQTFGYDETGRQLCSFDMTEPENVVELGCHDFTSGGFLPAVLIAQDA